MAKQVDPTGERTIGVLTKLDLMDAGTDAKDILMGRHRIQLKRDFVGVINRSQKDIDEHKDIRRALYDERKYFIEHPAYGPDMADKMGIRYLQEYLQRELSLHIFKRLPPLKPKLETKLDEVRERLAKIEFPLGDRDKDQVLAEAYDKMRSGFDSGVGGKVWGVDTDALNGGTRINTLMNETYAKAVNKMFYDETRIRREIGIAIQNAFGTRIGVFIPDTAFISVVMNQIGGCFWGLVF
jgi:dynamin 1-like protein